MKDSPECESDDHKETQMLKELSTLRQSTNSNNLWLNTKRSSDVLLYHGGE